MHEPVKNRVRQCRLADGRVSVIDWELTGYEGGPAPVAIIKKFQQIAAVLAAQGHEPPVIQHYEVHLGETPEQTPIAHSDGRLT